MPYSPKSPQTEIGKLDSSGGWKVTGVRGRQDRVGRKDQ